MWHPDPDRLALAALPAEQADPDVRDHLGGCALCRGHVKSLRRTVDLAVSGATGSFDEEERPPERVWAAITGELDIVEGAEPSRRPSRRRRTLVPVAAAALAAAVGVAAGLVVGLTVPSPAPEPRQLATLAALDTSGASGTAAVVERDGLREVVLRVDGVAPPADTDYLEVWLMDASGTRLLSLGALATTDDGHRGVFSVPDDLPMAEFGTVDVSAERWDGDERHSTTSLLRGPIT